MKFKLTKKTVGKLNSTFHVTDQQNAIVGSITVRNEDANDLLKHWLGAREERKQPEMKTPVAKRMTSPKMKAAILRGC